MQKRSYLSGFDIVVLVSAGLLLLAVGLSYMGHVWWGFELFTHFVMLYLLAALVIGFLLLFCGRPAGLVLMLLVAGSQGYKLLPFFEEKLTVGNTRYDQVQILQYNVHRNNTNVEEMAQWIIGQKTTLDIVVLTEVTDLWKDALVNVAKDYPYHVSKDMRGGRQLVVLSRLPMDRMEILYTAEKDPLAIALHGTTLGHEQPFVVYGIHPPPPMNADAAEKRNKILKLVSEKIAWENVPHKIIVGDFNCTRFSPVFAKMVIESGLRDSNHGLKWEGIQSTWPSLLPKYLGVTIDNLLVSDAITVLKKETGPAMGSDHRPVVTTLRLMVKE